MPLSVDRQKKRDMAIAQQNDSGSKVRQSKERRTAGAKRHQK